MADSSFGKYGEMEARRIVLTAEEPKLILHSRVVNWEMLYVSNVMWGHPTPPRIICASGIGSGHPVSGVA